jgi:hypothetical protein
MNELSLSQYRFFSSSTTLETCPYYSFALTYISDRYESLSEYERFSLVLSGATPTNILSILWVPLCFFLIFFLFCVCVLSDIQDRFVPFMQLKPFGRRGETLLCEYLVSLPNFYVCL